MQRDIDATVRSLIADYVRRSITLRQIHSDKAGKASRAARRYVIQTVLVATVVTLIGFIGFDRVADAIDGLPHVSIDSGAVEAVYTVLVLVILLITILGLVNRFEDRASRHYRSVETLTEFIRDYEDALALSRSAVRPLTLSDLVETRSRYKGLLMSLIPNTDEEYARAKRNQGAKEQTKAQLPPSRALHVDWLDDTASRHLEMPLGEALVGIISRTDRVSLLRTVRDVLGEGHWLTGGAVREVVWDWLHDYSVNTPTEDVDIIFFDEDNVSRPYERRQETLLATAQPNVNWSVKNEARMHTVTSQRAFLSLEDAISKFPETATAVALRLGQDERIHVIAPHGLTDLFDLRVRPTPNFDICRFEERVTRKGWTLKWPKLQVSMAQRHVGEKRLLDRARRACRNLLALRAGK